jgi:type IV secretory pathway VirB10-like protein
MPAQHENVPATVPEQPEAKPPLRKSMPVVLALVVILVLIGLANITSLLHGNKKAAPASTLPMRPTAPNAQMVSSFETQQELQAQRDAEEQRHKQELAAAMQQLQEAEAVPGPEAAGAPAMTASQRSVIYGENPNGPAQTSEISQARAEAKQKRLAREKQEQDALNSDTEAIDFARTGAGSAPAATNHPTTAILAEHDELHPSATAEEASVKSALAAVDSRRASPSEATLDQPASGKDPMAGYTFDTYAGRLYRVFEGTVLEGVVTNHIDGGFSGPIMVSLTTDLYSHDHQQLLLSQGTRLLGTVQSVGNAQQRKMFVTFHRAICPDGFSLELAKYIGLDQIGTTGLATNVNHGYLVAFAAAAFVGGLGGLAQIGNNGSVLDPATQIRNGISAQSAAEGEQVLNHFLNRLPVITLKEGSRARVYIGTDLLIPSYAEHRVDPTL